MRLYTLVGKTSKWFACYKSHNTFDAGTKILFLQRALIQKPATFQLTLDRIYAELIDFESLKETLKLIIGLKLINDLLHDGQPSYARGQTALEYHFDVQGKEAAADVREVITFMVRNHNRILGGRRRSSQLIEEQKVYRSAEAAKPVNNQWCYKVREDLVLNTMTMDDKKSCFEPTTTLASHLSFLANEPKETTNDAIIPTDKKYSRGFFIDALMQHNKAMLAEADQAFAAANQIQ